jgi:DNA-binding NarL/FixJ family response regulator
MVAGSADSRAVGVDHHRNDELQSRETWSRGDNPMNAVREHRKAEIRHAYAEPTGPAGRIVVLDRVRRARPRGHGAVSPAVGVVIADGQALVRAGFRVLLESGERIAVVGEAADGEDAVRLAGRLRPEVVLIDADLPGLDCVEATRRIRAQSGAAVMLLTASESDERIFAALRAGAGGVLLKDTEPDELVRAVELLVRGDAPLSPSLTRRLITELASRPEPQLPDSELLDELTAREREVAALVALGLSNDEIAERLVVSPATAKTHVSRAMIKVQARDRAQLVVFAYETGLAMPRADASADHDQPLVLVT